MAMVKLSPLVSGQWSTWIGSSGSILMLDSRTNKFKAFKSATDCILFLYLQGHEDAANSMHHQFKLYGL